MNSRHSFWHFWPLAFALFFGLPLYAAAQGGGAIWYFGYNAGLDFNTNPPTPIYDGAVNTNEGCASLTDMQGNLLMYTDGITVYNRLHNVMQNGTGLTGDPSSTQSGIIVPQPGNDSIYFIFTTPASAIGPLCYSKVNMTLDNGLGAITTKNVVLHSPSSEQLSAVKHANGIDYWVMARAGLSNTLTAYLVTAQGVDTSAVVSVVGPTPTGTAFIGQLKFSPDGQKMAQAFYETDMVMLCDFDAGTGIASNAIVLQTSPISSYGLEFSPSGQYLYPSVFSNINQWDISLPTPADISASRLKIIPDSLNATYIWALQIANNGKIYIAKGTTTFLGVIHNPDLGGAACNLQLNAVNLAPKYCAIGLPTFNQSSVYTPATIIAQNYCSGSATQFSVQTVLPLQNHLWDFGDPASGAANTSSDSLPSHTYSAPGQYTVTLVSTIGTSVITQSTVIQVLQGPAATVLPVGPVNLCAGESTNLQTPDLPEMHYQWMMNGVLLPNDTLPDFMATASGFYQVLVSDSVCATLSDTIEVTVHPVALAQVTPDNPLPVCEGEIISLNAGQSTGNTFAWLLNGEPISGANGPEFDASSSGQYQVIASSSGFCPDTSGLVTVTINPNPQATMVTPGPVNFCADDNAVLEVANLAGATYQWLQNGSLILGAHNPVFAPSSSGNYQVIVTSAANCSDTSGVTVATMHAVPVVMATAQNGPNCGDAITLTASGASSYLWNTGQSGSGIFVQPAEATFYTVTGQTEFGCSHTSTVLAEPVICEIIISVPNIITPNNDGYNDVFELTITGQEYDLQIFNRWGQEIYNRQNYSRQQNWPATNQANGVYFYFISTSSGDTYKGWIEVLK